MNNLDQRIDEAAAGIVGIQIALTDARAKLGDEVVERFLGEVHQKGGENCGPLSNRSVPVRGQRRSATSLTMNSCAKRRLP